MRVGLNLLYMIPGVVGGTETYAYGLIDGLKQLNSLHEFVVFLNRESADLKFDSTPNFHSVVCPVQASSRGKRYFFEQVQLRNYVKKYGINVLHSLGYAAPVFLPCVNIVSVPDLNFRAFGHSMSLARRAILETFVRQSVARSDKVITISEFSRQEILKAYHVPPEKVVVTHLAVANKGFARAPEEGSDAIEKKEFVYCVAFSSSYPNKNIARLIEAFQSLRSENKIAQKLILIGHKAGSASDAKHDDVIWTGYVERSRVFDILKGADFLVFPSFYEGFGLPVLEAMSVGVPVVCSASASLPEVAGEAAVYFDPFSVGEMAEQIRAVATSVELRKSLREKGLENLKRFSWKKTAAETVAVYEQVVKRRTENQNFP